jgi:hypothetical protein
VTAYDAGVLVAADRGDRRVWAEHLARLELGLVPLTTAPVVSQVSRSGRQVQLRRFLRGCAVVPFASEDGHVVGALAGTSEVADVVDIHLVVIAGRAQVAVLTSDEGDLRRVAAASEWPVRALSV